MKNCDKVWFGYAKIKVTASCFKVVRRQNEVQCHYMLLIFLHKIFSH